MPSHEKEINTTEGVFILDSEADAKMLGHLAESTYPQQGTIDLVVALGAQRVVDVGAHVGTVSVPLQKRGLTIIAFEPNPTTFSYLRRNAARNNVHIDARNKGLGDKPGYASIVAPQRNNAGAQRLKEGGDVPVSTLDAEISETDFIKIDVEGMELQVLEGGQSLIERSHPAIVFEVNLSALRVHGIHLNSLKKFFTSRGYRLYFIENRKLYTLPGLFVAALLIAPRSLLIKTPSAPFDVLALPIGSTLPYQMHSPFVSVLYLLMRYIKIHYARFFR